MSSSLADALVQYVVVLVKLEIKTEDWSRSLAAAPGGVSCMPLLGGSQPAAHFAAREALDLKQVIEIVSSLHSDKLGDRLPPSLVVNTIGRVPMLARHGTQECEIALSQRPKRGYGAMG